MTNSASPDIEREVIALDRLRLLSLGYYISGAIGAAFVSFLLIHFFLFLGFSFIPQSQWDAGTRPPAAAQQASPTSLPGAPPSAGMNQGPPAIMFRIFAAIIGVIIIAGWTLGALTTYAGHCIKKRKHKIFIYVMAAVNCIWIPYGTLLGIATIILFQWPEVQAQFKTQSIDEANGPITK
jgi:hypothetical protein